MRPGCGSVHASPSASALFLAGSSFGSGSQDLISYSLSNTGCGCAFSWSGATSTTRPLLLAIFQTSASVGYALQWVWTSFEHVSNVPTAEEIAAKKLLPRYNFFNAKCSDRNVCLNAFKKVGC
jgi:hypothetical protein